MNHSPFTIPPCTASRHRCGCINEKQAVERSDTSDLTTEMMEKLGICCNESMKKHTSFRVGGPADFFARPPSIKVLQQLLHMADLHQLPITLMGGGTNLLVKDRGIRGLVISMAGLKQTTRITPLPQKKYQVRVSAGTLLAGLYRETMEQHIGGIEFAAGIPGTVGGAVMMNAGTHGGSMSDVVTAIDLLDGRGKIVTLAKPALKFAHRSLSFNADLYGKQPPVLVSVTLTMAYNDREKIQAQWQALLKKRRMTQPAHGAGAGCFFKNPLHGKSAGELIDRAGLKGFRVGDAMVSERHANFIVNAGKATARDILSLKQIIETEVHNRFGILLENEVKIEGE